MSKLDNLKWRKTYIKQSKKDAKVTTAAKSEVKTAEPNSMVPVVSAEEGDVADSGDANGNIA